MIKVKATKEYELNNVSDSELGRIPKEGDEFEISENRLAVLTGKNRWKKVFVVVIEDEDTKDEDSKEAETKEEDTKDEDSKEAETKDEEKTKPIIKPENKAILDEDKKNNNVKKSVLSE